MTNIYEQAETLIGQLRQSVAAERRAARAEKGIAEPEGSVARREAAYVQEETIRRLGNLQHITGAALLLALWRFYASGEWLLVGEYDSFEEWAESAAPSIESHYLAQYLAVIAHVLGFVHSAEINYQGARLTPERLIAEAGVWRLINMTSLVRGEADPARKQAHILAILEAPSRDDVRDYINHIKYGTITIRLPYIVVLQPDGTWAVLLVGLSDEQFRMFELLTHGCGQEVIGHQGGPEIDALIERLQRGKALALAR